MTRRVKAGSVDVSVNVHIIDSTDGTPENGVVWNTAGIDLWYRREGAAFVSITEATLAALTTAHTDGGFLFIRDGDYRLDLPDAACASGVAGVQIGGTVTGMIVLAPYIELDVNTPTDVYTRIGAPAGASVSADIAAIEAQTDDIGAAGAGLTAIPWAAAWDVEVQSEVADALAVYDPPTNAEMEARTIAAANYATAAALDIVDNFLDTEIGTIVTNTTGIPTAAGIADAVWDEATSGHQAAGSTGKALTDAGAAGTPPTVGEIADGVWDEAMAGHLAVGSTGEKLNAAASAGDPWTTALPGAYGAGSAGKIVGDNINATVSSRATQTSVDDLPTNAELATSQASADDATLTQIALVKAQTDLIPGNPAAEGSAMTLEAGERDSVADAFLDRDMAAGVDSGSPTVRTVRQALRFMRNKWSVIAGTLTITKEDDATASWTAVGTSDPVANPITGIDPAGP